jgi:hypothetical protein
MYFIVVYRPLPAAPLVVRCMYMAVVCCMYMAGVQRPMPAALASRCCGRRFQQLAYDCGAKSRRGAQADARGATQELDRSIQAVARGAARCLLHVLSRSAKTDACGRSFAVFSTQVLKAGLLLRHNRLTC